MLAGRATLRAMGDAARREQLDDADTRRLREESKRLLDANRSYVEALIAEAETGGIYDHERDGRPSTLPPEP